MERFSHIFDTPGLDSCYVEICKLLALLIIEPDNRMLVFRSPLMNHLRSLRRWKGSDVAHVAGESIIKLEKHADRVRKMEKEKKKADRQIDAANRHKKKDNASPSAKSLSPHPISPQSSKESLDAEAPRHRKPTVKVSEIPTSHPPEVETAAECDTTASVEVAEVEEEEDIDAHYGDPDYM